MSAWITGTYDPNLGLAYWGTGNAAQWIGDQRPGDNLYSASVLALDADTGKIRGYHQYHWNDSWDWDEVSAPILMDVTRGGRTIKSLVHPARNGYLWVLERKTDGIGFVDAKPYVNQTVFTKIDAKTGRPTYDDTQEAGHRQEGPLLPLAVGRQGLGARRLQPEDRSPLHPGQREPVRLAPRRACRSTSRASCGSAPRSRTSASR